jgi:hypothetical protein
MITKAPINTERLELPTEEIIKEREDLKQVIFIEPSKTSSELQSPTALAKFDLAYYPLSRMIIQRIASREELDYGQLSHINVMTANYDLLLESILGISREETLSPYPSSELERLEWLYILRRRSEVIKFLMDNIFLLPLLQEAYERIRNYFGKSAQIFLEIITDPEVTGDQELVIFIRTNLSLDEAFKKLEQLDREWWLDAPTNAREKLCIDVEFE